MRLTCAEPTNRFGAHWADQSRTCGKPAKYRLGRADESKRSERLVCGNHARPYKPGSPWARGWVLEPIG